MENGTSLSKSHLGKSHLWDVHYRTETLERLYRRRRTFPVTRRLSTNRVPLKTGFFGKFDPLMECEKMYREPTPGHVFVGSLAEIDPTKVAEVVRGSRHRKKTTLRPIFSRSVRYPYRDFAGNVQGLVFSGFNPICQVSSKSTQVISENDLPDRYNNRRSDRYRVADNDCVNTMTTT